MADRAGTLTFHYPGGDEIFVLDSATVKVIRHSGEVELFFYVRGEGKVDGRRALTNAEVSVFLPEFDPAALVGRRFEVPRSYDEEREDHVSCFYHYEHRDLNRNVVEMLGRDGERFRVRWTGITDDADSDEGSEQQSRVVIEAAFELVGGVKGGQKGESPPVARP
jgi:hypothetical protein